MTTTTYSAVRAAADATFAHVQLSRRDPEAGQVRVAVEACGVCHSDVAGIYNLLGNRPADEPVVPGHEVIGRIDALGERVTDWSVGQRVGIGYLGGHCGVCDSCQRGDFVYCLNQPILGDGQEGGYAESVIVRERGLVAVPDGIPASTLAPLMCAGLTMYNALRISGAQTGDLVAIQGVGGLGHLGIQYAKAMGFRVAAIARGTAKEGLATELGADHYIDSTAVDPAEALQQIGTARAIVATASHGGSMSGLIDGLGHHGTLVVVGAALEPIEVSTPSLIFGGRSIVGTLTGTPEDNAANIAFALEHGITPMVESVPLAQADAAFKRMMSGDARFRMVLEVAPLAA
jgi:propanol-preferring alcohol dehydrogenase